MSEDLLISAKDAKKIATDVVAKKIRAKEMSDKAYTEAKLNRLSERIAKASQDGLSYIFVSDGDYNEAAKSIECFNTECRDFDSDISRDQYITAKKIIQALLCKGYDISPSAEAQECGDTKRRVKGMTVSWL